MITTTNMTRSTVAQAVLDSEPLTSDEKAALLAELNQPEYAGKSGAELLSLLNTRPSGEQANPIPQERVARTYCDSGELGVFTARCLGVAAMGNDAQKALADALYKQAMAMSAAAAVDLSDAQVIGGLQMALQAGLCSQEQLTNLTTIPDPAYRPFLPFLSPAETLLGEGVVLELGDLEGAN